MRRLPFAVLFALLAWAPPVLAAAGGGSSGFGGGGGGGGGGGFSGGGSGGTTSGSAAGFVFVALIVLVFVIVAIVGFFAERRRRRRRDARAARVRLAAAEAAEDDGAFHPEVVEREAAALFTTVQKAWTARDVDALVPLCGPDLLVEWRRRLKDFARKGWHNQVTVVGEPEVHYVGLVNREADDEDRVVVLVEATLRDVVVDRKGQRIKRKDSSSETTTLREYWTLAKRDGRWTLRSIEQLGEGDHHLESEIVASPWGDGRLRDEALVETAVADAAGDAAEVAQLVDLDFAGDARAAALDLSLVDGRFAPDVLEACARAAVAAWVEAIDGEDDPLLAVADQAAVDALLYPRGDRRARRVVRGARVEHMTLVALDGASDPPRMVVELALAGRRYLEDRDTAAVLDGSREREVRWTERWTFALRDGTDTPWTVAGAGDAPVPQATA
ncbi:MAG TPA: TIM44-like domain-containing protein [Capillimicrobium sp.]|nr:TIM44-like domain-containing protein [Capillimicrobium sp.]